MFTNFNATHLRRLACLMCLTALPFTAVQAQAVFFFSNTPYLSVADRPAGFGNGPVLLEDFEDGLIDPRLTVSAGVVGPGGPTDSVDADDGTVDGSGSNGHSAFSFSPVEVSFAAPLPTAVSLVWTDGGTNANVTFEAFGPTNLSLGTIGPVVAGDASILGTTAEDRFFGVNDLAGISRVRISHTSGGYEIDHIAWSESGTASAPDLSLSLSSASSSVAPGGTLVYALNYACNLGTPPPVGPSAKLVGPGGCASGVVLTDTVPANSQFASASSSPGWNCTPNNLAGALCTFAVGTLADGQSASSQFALLVDAVLPAGVTTISNAASISDDAQNGSDPNPVNNTSSLVVTIAAALAVSSIPSLNAFGLFGLALLIALGYWLHSRRVQHANANC